MAAGTLFWTLLAQAIGGVTPALTKLALLGLGPWSIAAGRQILGGLLLLLLARLSGYAGGDSGGRKPQPRFDARDWALLACMAGPGFALPMVLIAFGLERSTATHGALLAPVEPIGILLGGALLLAERPTPACLISAALGCVGATLIVLGSELAPATGDPLGDLLILLGYLAWAVYTLAAKSLLDRHDATRVSLWAVGLSIAPLALCAATEPIEPERAQPALLWVGVLALVSTAVATFSWNRALQSMRAGTMAAFIFVQPVVGLALGLTVLGETAGPSALLGTALIVTGATLAAWLGEGEPVPALPPPPELAKPKS
jgi:drug/metabolite transporter (DMT)-like permease